jgi:acetylornithine/succinyldiaminopimelate/putrescine aminotransferase
MEPVQAEAGVILQDPDFLKAVRNQCDKTGTMLILDEIQTGMGRTGTMFCFEQYDFIPDILLLAKSLGGGLPLGAFISSRENMRALISDPVLGHVTTFGGNPVCTAAGKASMEVILEENLMAGIQHKSELFGNILQHPAIRDFRKAGLLMALEFEDEYLCKAVIRECIANGVILDWFLFASNCIRIAPPLTISDDEIKESCKIILQAMQKVFNGNEIIS